MSAPASKLDCCRKKRREMDMNGPLPFAEQRNKKQSRKQNNGLAHMKNAAGKRNFLAGPLHSLPYFSCDATASHSLPANRAGIGSPLSVAIATVTAIAVAVAALLLPGRRVQDQAFVRTAVREVEHAVDRAGYRVKRAATDAFALEPIVFDEAD